MPVSTRTRFEVFKRDDFTCQYCGRKSPEVVLEVDHIIPRSDGGSDDNINLTTSCWDCNRGKSDVPLNEVMTGEDPHDAAMLLLEKKRQLEEYNYLLAEEREQREYDHDDLMDYWNSHKWVNKVNQMDSKWMMVALNDTPKEAIRNAMDVAIQNDKTRDLRYVAGVLRRWKERDVSDN